MDRPKDTNQNPSKGRRRKLFSTAVTCVSFAVIGLVNLLRRASKDIQDQIAEDPDEPSFRLFDLPRELRDRIYFFVFSSVGQPEGSILLKRSGLQIDSTTILQSSSLLRKEALNLLFGRFIIRYAYLIRHEYYDNFKIYHCAPRAYIKSFRYFEVDLEVVVAETVWAQGRVAMQGLHSAHALLNMMPSLRTLKARIWLSWRPDGGSSESVMVEAVMEEVRLLVKRVQKLYLCLKCRNEVPLLVSRLLDTANVQLWDSEVEEMPDTYEEQWSPPDGD